MSHPQHPLRSLSAPCLPAAAVRTARLLSGLLALLSLAILGMLPSCGADNIAIVVQVEGVNPDYVKSLYVYAMLGNQSAMTGLDIKPPTPLSSFGIQLPADTRGDLQIVVSGLGDDECKYALGKTTLGISSTETQTVKIVLNKLAKAQCSLFVAKRGDGSVTLMPTGKDCGKDCYDFDQGTTVTVSGIAGPGNVGPSYGGLFEGKCESGADCAVTLSRRNRINVGFQPPVCTGKRFCWYAQGGAGNWVSGIWGSSVTDVWAVGYAGTLLHTDGFGWTQAQLVTDKHLRGVWGTDSKNVWVVGDAGAIFHFDGTAWATVASNTPSDLSGIWGSSATDVWAVGSSGVILHFDGQKWSAAQSPTQFPLRRIYGSSASNIWAVGQGAAIRFDGTSWKTAAGVPTTTTSYNDVWTSGPDNAYIVAGVGYLFANNNGNWTESSLSNIRTLYGITGTSKSDIWVAGDSGYLLHSIDGGMNFMNQALPSSSMDTVAVFSLDPNTVFAGFSNGNLMQVTSSTGSYVLSRPSAAASKGFYRRIIGTSATDVWAVRNDNVVGHWDGQAWTEMRINTSVALYDIWAGGGNDVWVTSDTNTVYRYMGNNSWQPNNVQLSAQNITAIYGLTPTDIWVGSNNGDFSRWNGISWTKFTGPRIATVRAIYGRSTGDYYAVGNSGFAGRFDGTSWSNVSTPGAVGTLNLTAIHGSGSELWATGLQGILLKWGGSAWNLVPTQLTTNLNGVFVAAPGDVWVGGDNGTLLHVSGTTVTTVPSIYGIGAGTARNDWNGLWGTSTSDFWGAVSYGNIVRYQPQ